MDALPEGHPIDPATGKPAKAYFVWWDHSVPAGPVRYVSLDWIEGGRVMVQVQGLADEGAPRYMSSPPVW